MIDRQGHNIPPEWLAAYADGEMDRNALLAPFKKQVEDWLAEHPEAMAEVEEQRLLLEFMQETAPAEPDNKAWASVLARLEEAPGEIPRRRARSMGWLASLLAMTAAALWLAFFLPEKQPEPITNPQAPWNEPAFEVAAGSEIEVLSVEGEDTNTLVVGEFPGRGPLELLGPGEMKITSVEPTARTSAILNIHQGPAGPMIWAVLDSER